MIYEPKSIALKDGRTALFRSPEPDDAAVMLAYMRETSEETEFVLRYPEECTMTEEQERAFLENLRNSPDTLMIACYVDGDLAGNCCLMCNSRIKTRHTARVAIGLYKRYWGLGIGTFMFEAMTAAARERGVTQLELDYIEGNDRARALYEKIGFVQYGEHPDAIRLRDGSFRKLVLMFKRL